MSSPFAIFFFFNDTAPTEIYTLSLHDALPVVDGVPIHYAGLEPISISAGNVTINGADLSGTTTEIGDKDLFKVSMNGAGTSIEVKDFDPTGTFELTESHSVSLSGLS